MIQFQLDGRLALVTGAGRGLGEAIAEGLCEAGAHVIVTDKDGEAAGLVADRLQSLGHQASAAVLDVTNEDEVEEIFANAAAKAPLQILVNNAGTYLDVGGPILDLSSTKWRYALRQNLEGMFLCSRQAAKTMVAEKTAGAIINITSVDSVRPAMGVGYDVAKAGGNHFTRSLAVDLAPHRIRVNAIAPGVLPVETFNKVMAGDLPPIFEIGDTNSGLMGPVTNARMANVPFGYGEPKDAANAAIFLASDASKYVTGQVIFVDGGWTLV